MNIKQAKSLPLVDFFNTIGYQPKQIKLNGNDLWYTSPLRPEEKTASFHINKIKNTWFDFGIGKGGNIIDFVVSLQNCDVPTALDFIANAYFSESAKTVKRVEKPISEPSQRAETFKLDEIRRDFAASSLRYIEERQINTALIQACAVQVHFSNSKGKAFFGIGMKNISDGYEVRNRYFKGCVGKKDLTFWQGKNSGETILIFEGMFDFFTALTYFGKTFLDNDVLILNSAALHERAIAFMKDRPQYKKISLFLDNDAAGQAVTDHIQEAFSDKIIEPSFALYLPHKDFNAFLMARNKKIKP